MKISFNWLKEYIQIEDDVQQIGDMLTMSGLEVEGIEQFEEVPGSLNGLVVGQVVSCRAHPDADRLTLTEVNIGEDTNLPIVCGAPNVTEGQKVVVAPVGTTLYPSEGEPFKIKKAKIRGAVSQGMICAEDEIGLGSNHEGIMVLPENLQPGTPLDQHIQVKQDQIIEIGLTPNRSDAISHLGVSRDLKALLGKSVQWPSLESFAIDRKENPITVVVENTEGCPRYSGLSFSNVKVGASPLWLQTRLKSIGLTPINNVVDITNFVMHEMGQPMHAFDADYIGDQTVLVKTLPDGATFVTLDEKERKLNHHDLMIVDGNDNGMCIAGVFGGIKSGVTEKTSNVFLESAYFSADYVRKTALKHGLKTDASFRYERGTDPNMTVIALKRAAILLKEITGAEINSELIDIYPDPITPHQVEVSYAHIDRLIGKRIPKATIKDILTNLDFKIEEETAEGLKVTVPLFRTEVTREADVIEEVLRIYGYNNIQLADHYGSPYLAEFPAQDFDKLRFGLGKVLAAQGFWEIYTNSLTKEQYTQDSVMFPAEKNVVILNKLSEDLGVLRQTLLYTGLESVAYNINHRQSNLKFFEFGKVYQVQNPKADQLQKYHEQQRLSMFVTGNTQDDHWLDRTRPVEFHDLSAVIHKTLDKFKISAYNSKVIQNEIYQYGLEISVSDHCLVQLGKLSPEVCAKAEVRQPVFYADIDWEWLVRKPKDKIEFSEVAKYPEVRRDLSLVLDKHIQFSEIEAIAYQTEDRILKRINVFDVYEGEKIDHNKKAYALSFILQDKNRTLTDKIIDKSINRLMQNFEQQLGAIIRK